MVAFLCDATNNACVNVHDADGDTPLHYATFNRRLQIIQLLVARGADVNARNNKGSSVLHCSAYARDAEGVAFLLKCPGIDVNALDNGGELPLHDAIRRDNHELINLFGSFPEADFLIRHRSGVNVLHYAAAKGSSVAVRLIIRKARHLIESRTEDGSTPLLLASQNGHSDCVKVLLDEGMTSPDQEDSRGNTALHKAVHHGHAAVVEAILRRYVGGARKRLISKENLDGQTSLHIALSRVGEAPVPLSPLIAPAVFRLAQEAESCGVPRKLVHPMAIGAYLVTKGGKLSAQNSNRLAPLDHVCDEKARKFLRNIDARLKAGDVQQAAQARPEAQPARAVPEALPAGASPAKSLPECRVCSENLPCVIFEPCGHRVVCAGCSKKMKKCLRCDVIITEKILPTAAPDSESERQAHVLAAKIQDYEEKFLCSICLENSKTTVFLCGHAACSSCAQTLTKCHMCRSAITRKIQMY